MKDDLALQKFEIRTKVKDPDIDVNGHVNNTIYVHWVQNAAVAHWTAAATHQEQEDIVWMLTRHEIDYKLSLISGDEVIVRTWVGKASELKFERHTEVVRASDNKVAAVSKTLWIPINKKTGKIMRVNEELRRRFSIS